MKKHLFKIQYFIFLFILTSFGVRAQQSLDEILKKYNTEQIPYISVEELSKNQDNLILIDAREKEEFNISHIKNAYHVGFDYFKIHRIPEDISKSKKIVVYCSLGVRSEAIAEKLRKNGYNNIYNLYGGIFEWKNKGFPVVDSKGNETENIHAFSKEWSVYLKKGIKIYE